MQTKPALFLGLVFYLATVWSAEKENHMNGTRDPKQQMRAIRNQVNHCLRSTNINKQIRAELILSTVGLELTLRQLFRSRDLEERSSLQSSFEHSAETIQQAIQSIHQHQAQNNTAPLRQ